MIPNGQYLIGTTKPYFLALLHVHSLTTIVQQHGNNAKYDTKGDTVEFDLTTDDGRKLAWQSFDRWGWIYSPTAWLVKKAVDFISTAEKAQEQRKTAIELIKAGRENGLEEMRVTVDQNAGIDIEAKLKGIPIKTKIGNSGKITIEVKYRDI